MKVLIVEDELPAAKRLEKMILEIEKGTSIINVIDSIEDTIKWFTNSTEELDLIFMDIQLADGMSFEIFKTVQILTPVIFTTAFDQYAIQAFKSNGIDYLLKPIVKEEMREAITKYKNFNIGATQNYQKIISSLRKKENYKERFIVKVGEQFKFIPVKKIAYFYSESSVTYMQCKNGKKYILDSSLDVIENDLNPADFHKINRRIIIHINSITKISSYFNSRLKINLHPSFDEVIVSRERVKNFKEWLNY